ncbi:MAG: hypothetical protein PVH61_12950 [Candidatus Aminicenantes bacterium]
MNKITNSMYYNQGPEAGTMDILITCSGAAVGSTVSISSTKQGPTPLISLPKTTVTKPDFTAGIKSEVPAKYTDTLTAEYISDDTIAKGFSLTFSVGKEKKEDPSGVGVGPTPVITIKKIVTSV